MDVQEYSVLLGTFSPRILAQIKQRLYEDNQLKERFELAIDLETRILRPVWGIQEQEVKITKIKRVDGIHKPPSPTTIKEAKHYYIIWDESCSGTISTMLET